MTTSVLTLPPGALPPAAYGSLQGVNVTPMVYGTWNIKASLPAATLGDIIETPVLDLNQLAPNTNRIVAQKSQTNAGMDTLKLLESADGTNWFTSPLYNGGTAGGSAVASPNVSELALVGLPSLRYIKAQLTLAAAVSTQSALTLAISLMRF